MLIDGDKQSSVDQSYISTSTNRKIVEKSANQYVDDLINKAVDDEITDISVPINQNEAKNKNHNNEDLKYVCIIKSLVYV